MPLPSASIVLCTYNGQRFLGEQIQSLCRQTVPPIEVIAQDDGSTDSTLSELEKNAGALAPVLKVRRNPNRLGFAANFADALARATSEVIFFCDQDDIWEPEKIEALLRKFAEDPGLALAFSDGWLVGENGQSKIGSVLAKNGFQASELEAGAAFPAFLRRNPVPGMVMAIRASLREALLPIPPGWEHDYWCLLLATGLGKKIGFEPRPLVRYRQHPGQAVGTMGGIFGRFRRARGQGLSQRALEAERMEALLQRLKKLSGSEGHLRLASEKQAHLLRRSRYSLWLPLRALEIAAELGRGGYHRFDAGCTSALKDLLASR